MAINRRQWMRAAACGGLFLASDSFGASDFWNKKNSSAWTGEEVFRLATKSPWANDARVLPRPGRDKGGLGSVPDPSEGPGGRGGNTPGAVPVVPVTTVTVVWESAQPFLDSLKSSFPPDFANHYVIGVHKLPLGEGTRKVNLQNAAATLQARGKGSVGAGVIQPEHDFILCGFSKELFVIEPGDRDLIFDLETDQFSVRTRFDPKEMMYRGKLAV
jgi:hypothetical protein